MCEGKIPEAVLRFQTALQLKSDNAIARNNLNRSQAAMARIDHEIAEAQKRLKNNTDKTILYYTLAKLNTLRGRFQEAEKWYERAIEVDPRPEKALHDLIIVYILERNHDKIRSVLLSWHKDEKLIDGFLNELQTASGDESLIMKYLQGLGLYSAVFQKAVAEP